MKLQGIIQVAELHIEKQREVKAPRGRPAAATASSLYDDEMESTSQVPESVSDSDGEIFAAVRSVSLWKGVIQKVVGNVLD